MSYYFVLFAVTSVLPHRKEKTLIYHHDGKGETYEEAAEMVRDEDLSFVIVC